MNHKFLKTLGTAYALFAFVLLACLPAKAGPIPFTQNQFPLFYAVQSSPVSLTNAAETDLAVIPVPPAIMGNAGYMKITLLCDGDAGSNNKIFRVYLGGPGHTNATALYTNTFKQTVSTPVSATVFPYVGGYSNLVYSTIYTNFNAGALKQTVVVGSQTNGLYVTVSGDMADTHGTYVTLGGVIVEALNQ